VSDLYPDSINVDGSLDIEDMVAFVPFVGVAPRRYIDLFSMPKRKDHTGTVVHWDRSQVTPRLQISDFYQEREKNALGRFSEELKGKGILIDIE
jgi:hypothetical protein